MAFSFVFDDSGKEAKDEDADAADEEPQKAGETAGLQTE